MSQDADVDADVRTRRVLQLGRSPFEPALMVRSTVAGLALIGLGWVLGLPLSGEPPPFDARLAEAMTAPQDTTTFAIVEAIGRVGHLIVVTGLAVVVALIARWRSGGWGLALLMVAVLGGATAITGALKLLVDRARPDDALTLTAAFPSGHAVRGVAVFVLVGWIVRAWSRRPTVQVLAIPVALVLVAVNGVARVMLGVHWPTDVLVGFLLGGSWVLISFALVRPRAVDAPC